MKVGIIGGGAAGMTAAIQAARRGFDVTILEHMDRIGKKILATGNGRCNLTNINQSPEHYHGTHSDFAGYIFQKCSYADTLRFFTQLGIYTKNRNGGLYPYSEQASAVLDVLRFELEERHVKVICNTNVIKIKPGKQFHVLTAETQNNQTKEYFFDKLILTTGGKAAKHTGSDGSGYELAKELGHHVIEPLPALVQLRSSQAFFKGLAGIRCEARLKLMIDDRCEGEEQGELQITDYGISGIPVFQLSGRASRALYAHKSVLMLIDFMPDMPSSQVLEQFLTDRSRLTPHKRLQDFLIGILHKNLCLLFLKQCNLKGTRTAESLTQEEIQRLAACIRQFQVEIQKTNSFEQAQTCTGGIDTSEIHDTLESKLVPGLYFAGELIDIDGDCGGYNLQWAWSTGMLASLNL